MMLLQSIKSVCLRSCRYGVYALVALLLHGCGKEEAAQMPQYADKTNLSDGKTHYVFAVHPLHNPQLLQQKFSPLMRYLSEHIPNAEFDLDASNNYQEYEGKLKQNTPHFSLPNPYHAVLARGWGYHVIAKMGNDDVFRGIFLVRIDSPVKEPSDLKGQVVAYPAPTALAAAMMPQLYLQTHGVDVATQLDNQYVGTHNSSIMNAYLKQSAASATWPVAWEAFKKANPKEAAELKVIWQTEPLIQNAVIVRNDVPAQLADQVRHLLATLKDSPEGRQVLESADTSSFDAADDRMFDMVENFLKTYEAKVKKTNK